MKELVLATHNKHKISEIRQILREMSVTVRSLDEFRQVPEVVEDGKTLQDNAIKKARSIALRLKKWALADDSGLEVAFLNNEPGVYSARWAGPGCSYDDNNRKLLGALKRVPAAGRKARFRTVIALADPRGTTWWAEGKIAGTISNRPKGRNGFGYDPVFIVPVYNKTFAELALEIKNKISHRARALSKAKRLIKEHMLGKK
jgi:XTP/dITP diphosphohydrolase